MPAPTLALRARLLCVLTASLAACTPAKDGAPPPTPDGTAATTTPKSGPPPSLAEGEPPRPAPSADATEAATSGPAPSPAPGKCDPPKNRCFPPRSDMRGAMVRVDLSKLPFDKDGCLPQDQVGGSCLGFRPTSGPTVKGGQCCYDGCSAQPAPCGRPLLVEDGARVAELRRGRGTRGWA